MSVNSIIDAIYDILPKEAADYAIEWIFDGVISDIENGIGDENSIIEYLYNQMFYIYTEDLHKVYEDCEFIDIYEDASFPGAIGFNL